MFLRILIIAIAIFDNLQAKPIIVRNISDCSITDDGIIHYHGKHSYTKFEHECLLWTDLQTIYPGIINEANFFNDISVKAAKNYCRNPNMNINGAWCFVQDEDTITMEGCNVCQSLVIQPTLPTNIEEIDDVTIVAVNNGFFQNFRDDLQRYAVYLREKFMEIIQRMKEKVRHLGSKITDRFNFNG